MRKRIDVTKTFLPPIEEYQSYVEQIYSSGQLTNQGPLLKKFEKSVREYLGVKDFHMVANGTMALQIAIKALDMKPGEIITTPFSYVATTSAILWEGHTPVYADIDSETFNINPANIENLITDKTRAIIAVHVFGSPCNTEAIEKIASKHKLKIIYDGAHAFGVKYKKKSLLSYGDISICSFHATKPFHTIEGGCIIAKDKDISKQVELIKRFGHHGDTHHTLGINAKASEFHAAMGLCNLKHIDKITSYRKDKSALYDKLLKGKVQKQKIRPRTEYNYAYYPVLLPSEKVRDKLIKSLNEANIFPRRYFYPSLNTLPYIKRKHICPVSEDIASRILCLPLYGDLEDDIINEICEYL
jgi:dTDP-4-amino-4,6-dideoxygalactose transaminase